MLTFSLVPQPLQHCLLVCLHAAPGRLPGREPRVDRPRQGHVDVGRHRQRHRCAALSRSLDARLLWLTDPCSLPLSRLHQHLCRPDRAQEHSEQLRLGLLRLSVLLLFFLLTRAMLIFFALPCQKGTLSRRPSGTSSASRLRVARSSSSKRSTRRPTRSLRQSGWPKSPSKRKVEKSLSFRSSSDLSSVPPASFRCLRSSGFVPLRFGRLAGHLHALGHPPLILPSVLTTCSLYDGLTCNTPRKARPTARLPLL